MCMCVCVCVAVCLYVCVIVCFQGSYRCGPCKKSYIGDQKRGCRPERACGNGQPNPCHASAECIVLRDGKIECQVEEKQHK